MLVIVLNVTKYFVIQVMVTIRVPVLTFERVARIDRVIKTLSMVQRLFLISVVSPEFLSGPCPFFSEKMLFNFHLSFYFLCLKERSNPDPQLAERLSPEQTFQIPTDV
jgi:hypothetical protein